MAPVNPFKELESDVVCPPHLKREIVAEIDLIRSAVTIIDLYIGDLFNVASVLADATQSFPFTKKTES